jgi:hypothetical protein
LSYGYDFIGDRQKTTSNLIGQTYSFSSSAARITQGSLKIGTGVTIYNQHGYSLNAQYDLEHRNNYTAHIGSLRAKYYF